MGVRHAVGPWHRWRWVLRELRHPSNRVALHGGSHEHRAGSGARWGSRSVGALEADGGPLETAVERLRLLLARLSDRWPEWLPAEMDVPRTARGLKTWAGVEAAFGLTHGIAGLA